MESGWLAPVGPAIAGFEEDVARYIGVHHAVALSSGTAAIHLALKYLGVGPGDVVIVPTVTFGASAFPITYLGAEPVFVDVDQSWNLDPQLLGDAIAQLRAEGRNIAAVIPVDLYGSPANYPQLTPMLAEAGIPMLEDAAEGLGATVGGARVGGQGEAGVLSFNGNKIITTSGGGMLVTNNGHLADKVRYWSTQSRDPLPWYEHAEVGYNYRLSNLLAALGRSQLRRINEEVSKRRQIRQWYHLRLDAYDGVTVQHDPMWGRSNAWLTVVQFNRGHHPEAARRIRELLEAHDIESRPVWKPMHHQPVFAKSRSFLSGSADALYAEGLCLPSGSSLDEDVIDRICSLVTSVVDEPA